MAEPNGQLNVRPPRQVRQSWDEVFAEMAEQGDDQMLDEIIEIEWDEEWVWYLEKPLI